MIIIFDFREIEEFYFSTDLLTRKESGNPIVENYYF